MPVLGHAFLGLATAKCTRPAKVISAGAALWAPILVGLAYFPDIVNQLGITCGLGSQQVVTHSFFFAAVTTILIGPLLAWAARCSIVKAMALTLFSVVGHVALDLLQGSNRRPWWPFSRQHVKLEEGIIPIGMYRELALFGTLFAVFWVGHTLLTLLLHRWVRPRLRRDGLASPEPPAPAPRARRRSLPAYEEFPVPEPLLPQADAAPHLVRPPGERKAPYRRLVWAGRTAMVLILLAAGATAHLKGIRNDEMNNAMALVRKRDYAAALAMAEQADRWPYVGAQGWIEYVKAQAYEGLGDRERAEPYYLAAVDANPTYVWPLKDLIEFYASGKEPLAERRRRAEPYLNRLRTQFFWYKNLPQLLRNLERQLSAPSAHTPPPKQAGKKP